MRGSQVDCPSPLPYPGAMSYEVEIKFRSADHVLLRRRLAERGAVAEPSVVQVDTYMNHPCRDFARTNEAFRLRRIGAENRITYKGPKLDGPTKTREEIELTLAEGADAFEQISRLFEHLWFRPVATIRKERTTFHLPDPSHRIEVALDRAEGLGDFAEIEIVVASESELPAAQGAVLALAEELGLTEVEPRSYLRMALEARQPGQGGAASTVEPDSAADPRPARSVPPQTG
jgi:adenylate cyclase, class 2